MVTWQMIDAKHRPTSAPNQPVSVEDEHGGVNQSLFEEIEDHLTTTDDIVKRADRLLEFETLLGHAYMEKAAEQREAKG
ncbi:MAG: hypothetical protein PVG27_09275 [Chloroflexota bacterium]|jgi:hypothetical protein